MSERATTTEVRFGRTLIDVVAGELVDQPVQGIVCAANSRGVIGAGPAGALRTAAGADVERELMSHAPIDVGSAAATSPGRLAERGVETLIHACISPTIGERAATAPLARALDAALKIAIDQKLRSIALPLLGVSADDSVVERRGLAETLVDVLVKRLRQRGVRLERVLFVVRFDDDREMMAAVVQRARERLWTTSA
jgi:O-acetyl-ADP-ribose deacetylase (regulator of RNase III)